MVIRKATIRDIGLLIKLRLAFLSEVSGDLGQNDREAITLQLKKYFEEHLPDDSFIAILAEVDEEAVSTAFLAISDIPANLDFITGKSGRLLNVWTHPLHRRKGHGARVLFYLIDEARRAGVSSIDLAATSDGMPLYEKLGFKSLKESQIRMRLV